MKEKLFRDFRRARSHARLAALVAFLTLTSSLAYAQSVWTTRSTGSGGDLLSVTHGEGTFVTVGKLGLIRSSSNGTSWTTRATGDGNDLFDVVYGAADGNFVAVGKRGLIRSSANGTSWTTRADDGGSDLLAAAYGSGTFVTVGKLGLIRSSSTGTSWVTRASGDGSDLFDVIFANNLFVAVGKLGLVRTSSNGTSWTTRNSGEGGDLLAVTFGNGTYATVGKLGLILSSSNGTTWTTRASGTGGDLNAVTFGRDTFVAVGKFGAALTSTDGITWTSRTTGVSDELLAVHFAQGVFVATGKLGQIVTSNDGITWTSRVDGDGGDLFDVTFAESLYVVVGKQGLIQSAPPVLPLPPGALAAVTGSATSVNLSWTDASSNETGFAVQRKTGTGGTFAEIATPPANATSFSDVGLTPETQYFYRLQATNNSGPSEFSNEANATTLSLTSIEHWRSQNFGATDGNGDRANTADPDKDGLANSLEFALGLDPNKSSAKMLPVPGNSGENLVLALDAPTGNGLLQPVTVEQSTDLKTWTAVDGSAISPAGANPIPSGTNVDQTVTLPRGMNAKTFLRLSTPAQ